MKYRTGEKLNTLYGPGIVISVNERLKAYLIRWQNGTATWVREKDLRVNL